MDKHIDGDDAVSTPNEHDDTARDSLADLDTPGHVFDQTNGLADGLEGESDGTAEGAGEGGDPDTR